MGLHIFTYLPSAVYVSEPYLTQWNKILFDLLRRKYGFQELEYYYWQHVTKGIDHPSIFLKMVELIIDSMPAFGAMAACFQFVNP